MSKINYEIRLKCPKCDYTTEVEREAEIHLTIYHNGLLFVKKDWECCQKKIFKFKNSTGQIFRLSYYTFDVQAESASCAMRIYEEKMSKPHTLEVIQLDKKGKPIKSTVKKYDWMGNETNNTNK